MKFLPEQSAAAIGKEEIHSCDLKPILEQPQRSLAKVHYSWIRPHLEKFPGPLKAAAIAALTPEQSAGLSS